MASPNGAPTKNPRTQSRAVQTIAVTGGKGGVGKTSVAVNLATASAHAGKKVLLLDGDLGLANVDVLLGLSPRYTMSHVLSGERTLEEILVEAPQGFSVVPAASGVANMANLGVAENVGLIRAFSTLGQRLDMLIIDTAAGLSHTVLQFAQAAQHVLVVICDEPASMTDAYALVKVLSRNHGVARFHVVANMTQGAGQGRGLFDKFERVAAHFLDVTLDYVGEIPDDTYMRRAIRQQRPVAESFPSSPSGKAFKNLAQKADTWPVPVGPRGNLEFFVERLVGRPVAQLEVVR
ncbi:MAG TPA: P-loop NTPase [Steroidobacteraceae bacterium]|nr:P-loop NTPase [Steroidobacteraceae bacterium]